MTEGLLPKRKVVSMILKCSQHCEKKSTKTSYSEKNLLNEKQELFLL